MINQIDDKRDTGDYSEADLMSLIRMYARSHVSYEHHWDCVTVTDAVIHEYDKAVSEAEREGAPLPAVADYFQMFIDDAKAYGLISESD